MKIEVALQQVLGERDRAYTKDVNQQGQFFLCDAEGLGELKRRMDDLWDDWRKGEDKRVLRDRAKKIAAATLQYMTDCC